VSCRLPFLCRTLIFLGSEPNLHETSVIRSSNRNVTDPSLGDRRASDWHFRSRYGDQFRNCRRCPLRGRRIDVRRLLSKTRRGIGSFGLRRAVSIELFHIGERLADDRSYQLWDQSSSYCSHSLPHFENRFGRDDAHEAKAQLAHIARVTALGELTALIAHEVNQPLTAIVINAKASLHFLAAQPPNLEEARQAIECIAKDATRASDVVARVRGLAKRAFPQKELLNINETVNEIIKLTSSKIQNNHISLRTRFSDGLPLIQGDRVQLQQVILNLILNAIEAMNMCVASHRNSIGRSRPQNKRVIKSGSGRCPAIH
jgi:signal transduction histidine kinase